MSPAFVTMYSRLSLPSKTGDADVVSETDPTGLEIRLNRCRKLRRCDRGPGAPILIQHRHVKAALRQRRGDLQPDETGADDHRARRCTAASLSRSASASVRNS